MGNEEIKDKRVLSSSQFGLYEFTAHPRGANNIQHINTLETDFKNSEEKTTDRQAKIEMLNQFFGGGENFVPDFLLL